MGDDYAPNKKISLHVLYDDAYPPSLIECDTHVKDLFVIFDSKTMLRIYVTMGDMEEDMEVGANRQDITIIQHENTSCQAEELNEGPSSHNPIAHLSSEYDYRVTDEYFSGYQMIDQHDSDNHIVRDECDIIDIGGIGNDVEEGAMCLANIPFATIPTQHTIYQPPAGVETSSQRPDGIPLKKGDHFDHADKLVDIVRQAAIDNHWQYRTDRRDAIRVVLKCKDEKCPWMIGAYKKAQATFYELKKWHPTHTCTARTADVKHCNVNGTVVIKDMMSRFEDPKKFPSIEDIRAHAIKMGTKLSYYAAWYARQTGKSLIIGTRAQNYADLPTYLYLVTLLNPGSHYDVVVDPETNVFKYCFLAIGAHVRGMQYMRPMLVIDCAHMKKEPVQLVVCTSVDSEKHCYPVAWGLVEAENNEGWNWFLSKVREHVVPDHPLMTFLSDRNKSIINGVANVFPQSNHVHCYEHLKKNMNYLYRSCFKWRSYFWQAAYAFDPTECERYLNDMEIVCGHQIVKGFSPAGYLRDAGLKGWARSSSSTPRFEQMCSNHAESLNSCFLKGRFMKPLEFMAYLMKKMNKWQIKKYSLGEKMGAVQLTTHRETEMLKRKQESIGLRAEHVSMKKYRVRGDHREHTVDFNLFTCTCGEFQRMWFPCKHAAACAGKMRKHGYSQASHDYAVLYEYVSRFYGHEFYMKAYSEPIERPPLYKHEWDMSLVPIEVREFRPLPPFRKVTPGRDQETRYPSVGENLFNGSRKKYRCSNCKEQGHTKKTCKQPPI